MSLFPNKPSGAENAIVYFRCGVVNTTKQADGSFKCKADKRKGILTLERGNDVSVFFFQNVTGIDFTFSLCIYISIIICVCVW